MFNLNSTYGPWTTTLGATPHTRLSTFWRQRMKLLPLAHSAQRQVSWLAVLGVALCFVANCALPILQLVPAQDLSVTDRRDPRLEGTWSLVFGEDGGNRIEKLRVSFHQGGVIIDDRGDQSRGYQTDAKRSPAAIDFVVRDPARAQPQIIHRGIYQIRDDHLLICLNEAEDGDRPTEFKSQPRTESLDAVLLVLGREAPEAPTSEQPQQSPAPQPDEVQPETSGKQDATPPAEKPEPHRDNKASSSSKPWTVFGQVTDANGKPLADVQIRAATGIGTLIGGGSTTTDAEGKYELPFGAGIRVITEGPYCQAASIHASKSGYFEKNLSRQGDCVAVLGTKSGEQLDLSKIDTWKHPAERVFLPGTPKEINFVLLPSTRVAGRVVDADGQPLEDYSVSLTGKELPPSSSALAQVHTDAEGRFKIDNIPTGYRFQFLIEPPQRGSPWLGWSSGPMSFEDPGQGDLHMVNKNGPVVAETIAAEFEIGLVGKGTNWKRALEQTSSRDEWRMKTQDAHVLQEEGVSRLRCAKLKILLGNEQSDK